MLIDVHAHLGQTTPGAAPPTRITTYAGVVGFGLVFVSNRDAASHPSGAGDLAETDANIACYEACENHRYLAPLYWTRPGRVDSHVSALIGALESAPFAGIVVAPAANGFDTGDAMVAPYLEVARLTQRPVLFCIGPDDASAPAKVYEHARRVPESPVILCACQATATQRQAVLEVTRHAVERRDADLYMDTSHADARDIRATIATVGADRVLFGSNALVYGDAHVPRTIALLEELKQVLSVEDFRLVMGENAARVFHLGARWVR